MGVLGAAFLLAGCASMSATPEGTGGPMVGQRAPDVDVVELDGKPLSLASLRGRVVLLDVWASWCPPCKKELPLLDQMAARLKGKGIEILAVSIDEEKANAVRFLDSRARWTLTLAHDARKVVGERYRPEKMPSSFVIDKDGVVRHVNAGFVPGDEAKIERQLVDLAK